MKTRYDILDGLRGVAAISVLVYHLFEAIAFSVSAPEQHFYHGFLAVDFFFVLSGFVMGYAYDERLADGSLTSKGFILRRLIRLHPMVVMGVAVGLVCYFIQGCTLWDGTHLTWLQILPALVLALFLIPAPQHLDIRGNYEAFPINGPHWSLFFEYIGSLAYVLLLRRLPLRALKWWVGIMGVALFVNAFTSEYNSIAYGWSSEPYNLFGGSLRLFFAYPAGLLLSRLFRRRNPAPTKLPAFTLSAAAIVVLLAVPSLTTLTGVKILNPLYQCLVVSVAFPAIVWFGARGVVDGNFRSFVGFVGRLSYPLYAVHYPLIYLYIHWLMIGAQPFGPLPWATPVCLFFIAIFLGVVSLLCYDEPLRRWLSRKVQKGSAEKAHQG